MKSVWFAEERRFWERLGKFSVKETFLFCGKGGFFCSCKTFDKEKLFLSATKFQPRTTPKLTCNRPFQISLATVSLQQNIPFSKLRNLALAVQLPFRTDSNPHRRYPETLQCPTRPVTWWRPVTSAKILNRAEIWIEVAGRSPACFLCYFLHDAKSDNPFPLRELRGSANLDSARRNGGFAQTKLKPFETFRGFANLESVRHKSGFTVIYPIHLLLL